jgi:nitrate/nitrite transporter NarK
MRLQIDLEGELIRLKIAIEIIYLGRQFRLPPAMTFDVFGVRALDANMLAVPGTMPAFWTARATTMSVQVLDFPLGCHCHAPFLPR